MQEEEEAWRASDLERLTPTPSDNSQKSDGKPGNGTDKSENDNNDDNSNDILPGCYVLDINNSAVCTNCIWIRVSVLLGKTSACIHNQDRLNISRSLIT